MMRIFFGAFFLQSVGADNHAHGHLRPADILQIAGLEVLEQKTKLPDGTLGIRGRKSFDEPTEMIYEEDVHIFPVHSRLGRVQQDAAMDCNGKHGGSQLDWDVWQTMLGEGYELFVFEQGETASQMLPVDNPHRFRVFPLRVNNSRRNPLTWFKDDTHQVALTVDFERKSVEFYDPMAGGLPGADLKRHADLAAQLLVEVLLEESDAASAVSIPSVLEQRIASYSPSFSSPRSWWAYGKKLATSTVGRVVYWSTQYRRTCVVRKGSETGSSNRLSVEELLEATSQYLQEIEGQSSTGGTPEPTTSSGTTGGTPEQSESWVLERTLIRTQWDPFKCQSWVGRYAHLRPRFESLADYLEATQREMGEIVQKEWEDSAGGVREGKKFLSLLLVGVPLAWEAGLSSLSSKAGSL